MCNILLSFKKAAIYLVVFLLVCSPLTAVGISDRIYAANKDQTGISATEPESAAQTAVPETTKAVPADENRTENLPIRLSTVPAYEIPEFDQLEIPEIQDARIDAQNTLIAKRQEMDQDWLAAKEQERAAAEAKAAAEKAAAAKKSSGKTSSASSGSSSGKSSTSSGTKVDLGKFKLTAYCPCYHCSEGWGRMTSSGKTAQAHHTIAVDNHVIPEGSHVIINGTEYVAEDVGGGVRGNHIDIFYDSHSAALDFGVRYAEVYLVK